MSEKAEKQIPDECLEQVTGGMNADELAGILKVGLYYKTVFDDSYDHLESIDTNPFSLKITLRFTRYSSNSRYGDVGYSATEVHPADNPDSFISTHEFPGVESILIHEIY